MGGFNLQDLMSKAQAQYATLQKKMQETVVEASSGGGTVTAKMDGRKQLLSLRIDPEAVKAGDVEMLQDLDPRRRQRSRAQDRRSHAVHRRRHAGRSGHGRTLNIVILSEAKDPCNLFAPPNCIGSSRRSE